MEKGAAPPHVVRILQKPLRTDNFLPKDVSRYVAADAIDADVT